MARAPRYDGEFARSIASTIHRSMDRIELNFSLTKPPAQSSASKAVEEWFAVEVEMRAWKERREYRYATEEVQMKREREEKEKFDPAEHLMTLITAEVRARKHNVERRGNMLVITR